MKQPDLETFLVTVYTLLDDLLPDFVPCSHRGRPTKVSDAEVLTLSLTQQLLMPTYESRFLLFVRNYWTSYFPRQLSQSAFNKRVRKLEPYIPSIALSLAPKALELLDGCSPYELVDGVGIELMNLSRGQRTSLFGPEADRGRCGVPKRSFYGFKAVVAAHPAGPLTGWVVGPASTEERWLMEGLLTWRADPHAPAPNDSMLGGLLAPRHRPKFPHQKGPKGAMDGRGVGVRQSEARIYVCDLGYAGKKWDEHWMQTWGACVLTPEDVEESGDKRLFFKARQVVEAILSAVGLGDKMARLGARSECGARARLSMRFLAHNMRCFLNATWGRPTLAALDVLSMKPSSL